MSMETFENTHQSDRAHQHAEGRVARTIEDQTARLPSDAFLWGAVAAMAAGALLQLREGRQWSLFVGQWVAPLLLFGVYNKIVKVAGSDREHSDRSGRAGGLLGAQH